MYPSDWAKCVTPHNSALLSASRVFTACPVTEMLVGKASQEISNEVHHRAVYEKQ